MSVIERTIELSEGINRLPWLDQHRQQARSVMATMVMPARKTEHWLNTPVTRVLNTLTEDNTYDRPESADIQSSYHINDLDADTLVFVDGEFRSELSDTVAIEGVHLTAFSNADEHQRVLIAEQLNSVFSQVQSPLNHIFAFQNSSLMKDGALLQVSKNVCLPRPLRVVHVSTQGSRADLPAHRLLCVLESGAQASLIEQFVTLGQGEAAFGSHLTEIVLADNAQLKHYRLSLETGAAVAIAGVHVSLQRSAVYDAFNIGLGGLCKRTDIHVTHLGEGAQCVLKGVYLPREKQHIDYHTCIEHAVPHCTTDEVFRGIMADESKAVFNGRIHIHPDAQKTLAELSNKNLLLSPKAEIYTKPELEIYADDVRCAHGATVSQIDDKALYYMQSRGISRKEAEVMLSFGFINELIEQIEIEALVNLLKPLLVGVFVKDSELKRHIL
ncbi:Fe-S cluster assembly protein SufD [Gynuella sunshinyii]|uniref:ABC-type transport system involved in Fe-S cluster assembly, permease component n=1 Tax=Gynuella sunshinyii YC6258 TaxID=1445510 RepID=A0A0C5VBS5_9GAMM|nr:Fe-S cluster assembly protein SufD [Gynuella sunshinyii]AJQ96765.1 ABC-type transport system involved in Fe-S cluster assembly, permease component [Gynuella sunshinyii YC6258]